jgi:hypothetical protein
VILFGSQAKLAAPLVDLLAGSRLPLGDLPSVGAELSSTRVQLGLAHLIFFLRTGRCSCRWESRASVLSHNPVQPCMDPAAAVLLGSLSFDFVILPLRRRGLGLLLLVVFFLATSACPSSALCHFFSLWVL